MRALLILALAAMLSSCISAPTYEDPCEGLPPIYGTDC